MPHVTQFNASQTSIPQAVPAQEQQVIAAAQQGFDIKPESGAYYLYTTAQTSARSGPYKVKVDRDLAEIVLSCQKTGGRLSIAEAVKICDAMKDGPNKYGMGERAIVKVLLAACDDRCEVKLSGVKINITEPAERQMRHGLAVWWGSLADH